MTHYQVKGQFQPYGEWVYVKVIEYVAGQMVIRIDSSERLTEQEAITRCEELQAKHPPYAFMVTEEYW